MRWIVVGGGSAGCVVAEHLSRRADDEVLLLESGPDHADAVSPGDVGPFVSDPSRLRADVVVRRRGGPGVPYVRGHGLGGSSLVNGGVVTDPGSPCGQRLPLEAPWADGAVGAALLASDPTARRVRLIRRGRRRVTAADAYLRPAMHRANLVVRTGVEVRTVVVADRRAVAVADARGEVTQADRVVLCAGAIHTPAILLRSAIDTPGIGEGLEDHPAFTIGLRLRPGVVDPAEPMIAAAADHDHHQVLGVNHVAGQPDLAALMVALTDSTARGTVRLVDGAPVVELNQLDAAADVEALSAAVTATARSLDDPAWREIVVEAYADHLGTPLASVLATSDVADWVTGHLDGYSHAAATCRDGVVTDRGAVRGYEGLYVADAAALRGVPRHDPYVHVIANAERLASSWRDASSDG